MARRPALSLYTLLPCSFAVAGFLIAAGNLIGLPDSALPLVPPVDDLAGLFASSLFLFGVGLVAAMIQPLFQNRTPE